jgi:hypothetical protein
MGHVHAPPISAPQQGAQMVMLTRCCGGVELFEFELLNCAISGAVVMLTRCRGGVELFELFE